jgi:S-adenosylmethionine synthetase
MSAIYAAEFVFPGHPDKLCDAIADALVAEASRREKRALCGVEVAIHRSTVYVTGRIACRDAASIPVPKIVRDVLASAGYGGVWIPDPDAVRVETELCLGDLDEDESAFRAVSDDQSIVTGYAVDLPGTNYLPPEHWLAWRLSGAVEHLRCRWPELQLGPDGKVVVIYEQDGGRSRVMGFSASLQQRSSGPSIELHRAVISVLREELQEAAKSIPGLDGTVPQDIRVNGAGNFEVGGPEGDNGLSGKKLVIDAYGPRVPIGGGALSGKDFFKADRAGAILARRLAKLVVLTGVARECTATLAFLPGADRARVLALRDGAGRELDCLRWEKLVNLSLADCGDRYTETEDLLEVSRRGHFTQSCREWEAVRVQ